LSDLNLHLVAAALLLACQATPAATTPPPRTPAAAAAVAAAPASTTPPAPPEPPGEKPSVACKAPHPIADLPLRLVNVDEWAKAISAYRPVANSGRPVAWEGAQAELDQYLENTHACVHAAFADSFLRSLASLPKENPLSDPTLAATVELVIDGDSGALVQAGIVASSGIPEFDAAAVAAFGAAFPLAPPPAATLSSDGKLYVTWELHRAPEEACRREQARPWKLRF
jgi:hypothetical protein